MDALQGRSELIRFLVLVAGLVGLQSPLRAQLPEPIQLQTLRPLLFEEIPDPSSQAQLNFGTSVSIFDDTALVGIPNFPQSDPVGRVGIFRRDAAGVWQRRGSIESPDGRPDSRFGASVVLHRDFALVGSASGTHIFRRTRLDFAFLRTVVAVPTVDRATGRLFSTTRVADGSILVRELKIDPQKGFLLEVRRFSVARDLVPPRSTSRFAIWDDTFVVTHVNHNGFRGAAYVFERRQGAWRLKQELIASDGAADDSFGAAVRVHADTIVFGAPLADEAVPDPSCPVLEAGSGAVYVFKRRHGFWQEDQKLKSSAADPACVPRFGDHVELDGKVLLVTDEQADSVSVIAGWHVFERRSGQYQPVAYRLETLDRAGILSFALQESTLLRGIASEDFDDTGRVPVYDLTP